MLVGMDEASSWAPAQFLHVQCLKQVVSSVAGAYRQIKESSK